METDSKQVAEMVRSGEYFAQARAWYRAIYIAPTSERLFFLIIASIAAGIVVIALLALYGLFPLTNKRPVLVPTERMDDALMRLTPLRSPSAPINAELLKFFVKTYVNSREGYSSDTYDQDRRFIEAQSDAATQTSYLAVYDAANPRSPAAILGKTGKRVVTINSVRISGSGATRTATVDFSTDIEGITGSAHAEWTATLQINYRELVVIPAVDPETGKPSYKTQDPQFQVVGYVLTKTR